MKVFRVVTREENHEVDMITTLAAFETTEISMNVLIKVMKVLCIKHILVNTIEERED